MAGLVINVPGRYGDFIVAYTASGDSFGIAQNWKIRIMGCEDELPLRLEFAEELYHPLALNIS